MKNIPQKYTDFDILSPEWSNNWSTNWPWMPMSLIPHHTNVSNVSVWEEPNEVIAEAATPGMRPEEIEMNYAKGILTVRAERKEEKADEKRKFYQKSNTSFVYRLSIPGDIDEKSEPKAELKDGMLRIRFKKSEKTAPKKIRIQQTS